MKVIGRGHVWRAAVAGDRDALAELHLREFGFPARRSGQDILRRQDRKRPASSPAHIRLSRKKISSTRPVVRATTSRSRELIGCAGSAARACICRSARRSARLCACAWSIVRLRDVIGLLGAGIVARRDRPGAPVPSARSARLASAPASAGPAASAMAAIAWSRARACCVSSSVKSRSPRLDRSRRAARRAAPPSPPAARR